MIREDALTKMGLISFEIATICSYTSIYVLRMLKNILWMGPDLDFVNETCL